MFAFDKIAERRIQEALDRGEFKDLPGRGKPLQIEDDVIIAAGTTVTGPKVASGSLAVSRTPMKLVKDFYYKFFGKAKA